VPLVPFTFSEDEGWLNNHRVLLIWAFSWCTLLAALGHARHTIPVAESWLAHAQDIAYLFH
jgi:hypothetical protein